MKYVLKFHDDILKLDVYQFAQYWEGGHSGAVGDLLPYSAEYLVSILIKDAVYMDIIHSPCYRVGFT